jgi:hypothetical protein
MLIGLTQAGLPAFQIAHSHLGKACKTGSHPPSESDQRFCQIQPNDSEKLCPGTKYLPILGENEITTISESAAVRP